MENDSGEVPEKKRKWINSNMKEILIHMHETISYEKERSGLLKPLDDVVGRAAVLTGVCEDDVADIHSGKWKPPEISEEVPKKVEQPKPAALLSHEVILDDRDIIRIKNRIQDYHIKNLKLPSTQKLMSIVLGPIEADERSVKLLNQVLSNIGYRKKKLSNKKIAFIEDPHITIRYDDYIKTVRELRSSKWNIIYIYECLINSFHRFYKTWKQKYDDNEALKDTCTYTLICAASSMGFLKKATALQKTIIDKTKLNNCSEMTPAVFENWLKKKLIPNLPANSVVIMDDAPHHCVTAHKPISYYASKSEMVDYLKQKNIRCDESMRRTELHKLIEENSPKCSTYVTEDVLMEHGHRVLFLPPHMVDFNPMQLAMDHVQQRLYNRANYKSFALKNVTATLESLMAALTQEDWSRFFELVVNSEDAYWQKCDAFESAYDAIMKNLEECADNESDSNGEDVYIVLDS